MKKKAGRLLHGRTTPARISPTPNYHSSAVCGTGSRLRLPARHASRHAKGGGLEGATMVLKYRSGAISPKEEKTGGSKFDF
jgi:hypothetical protein